MCSFVLASFPVIEKHRQAYLQGKISRGIYIRNILFDVVGILLALILAALLGRYLAGIVTEQISNNLTKLIAGILVGLLIGLAVGIFVKGAWGRIAKTSPEN
jgi:NhaP-type Na+/H+ or K+/H+ antiporter